MSKKAIFVLVISTLILIISPAIGALLMSLSTVIVALNARLLRVEKLGEPEGRGAATPERKEA